MTDSTGHNQLAVLGNEINACHQRAQMHAGKAVENAIRCGQRLAEAKASVPHGQWLPWLRENVSFSERSVQAYMRAYSKYGANPQRVTDMSLREALAVVKTPRADRRQFDAEIAAMLERHRAIPAKPVQDWTAEDARACADRIREIDAIFHRNGMCCEDDCLSCDTEAA